MIEIARKHGKLISIEGLPCSGKTTLCGYLSKQLNFRIIPEIADFLPKDQHFPKDGENLNEVLTAARWFFDIECDRYTLADSLLTDSNVIMDRSFLTPLTYHYAYQNFKRITSHELLNQKMIDSVLTGKLKRPDLLIYLDISTVLMRSRRSRRTYILPEFLPDFWLEDSFLFPLISAYDFYIKKLDIFTFKLDGSLSILEVQKEALEAIKIHL